MKTHSTWYLKDVREKQNRDWTEKEKIRVYTLRDDMKAREIAKMFNTTINQVYNITRIVKKNLNDQCYHCGGSLEADLKRQIEKRAYQIFLNRGSQPSDPQEDWIRAEKEIRSQDLKGICSVCKEKEVEYKRNLRERALKIGLCGYCHQRKVVEGKKACKQCLSATHRRRKKIGLCGACGKRPVVHKGGALCSKCLKANNIKTFLYRQRKKNESHAS
jgi:transposase